MRTNVTERQRQAAIRASRIANGLCPPCGQAPPLFGYSICRQCRQYRLDKAAVQAFDRLVEYESTMRSNGWRRWREVQTLLGIGRDTMKKYIRTGDIQTMQDPWRRLWISAKAYREFVRRRSKRSLYSHYHLCPFLVLLGKGPALFTLTVAGPHAINLVIITTFEGDW